MPRVPVPEHLTRRIANTAVQYARQDVLQRGWKSSGALHAYYAEGKVGIWVSARHLHLLRQNRGFSPFVMRWVANRVIPMSCAQGDGPHFRTGVPSHIGTPGWVQIPHKDGGGPNGKTWRPIRWQHPGIKGKRFIEKSVQRAIKEHHNEIVEEMTKIIRGEA